MKIAYLLNQYPQPSHSFIRREIRALEKLGAEIVRITVRRGPSRLIDAEDLAEERLTRVVLDHPGAMLASLLFAAVTSPVGLARAIRAAIRMGRRASKGILVNLVYVAEAALVVRWLSRDGVDHLHAHFGTNAAAVALLCKLISGVPYSFTMHGPEEFDSPEALSLTEKIIGADAVVAISSFCRSQVCRWAPLDAWDKVTVVHCAVDGSFLEADAPPPPDARRLLSIGRLSEQKGHLLLLEAAAAVAREGPPFELRLVGDGPLRGLIERRIREMNLEGTVTLCGWQSGARIREMLFDSRALVLASFAEGLPVVIMEALALRRPVIATSISGIPELVEPSVSGWLVPAGSVEALAAALRHALLASTEELARLGAAGAARVARHHSADIEAGRLLATFRRSHP